MSDILILIRIHGSTGHWMKGGYILSVLTGTMLVLSYDRCAVSSMTSLYAEEEVFFRKYSCLMFSI